VLRSITLGLEINDSGVKDVLEALEVVLSAQTIGRESAPYVEVLDRNNEVWIGANESGLLQLAVEFLRLALRDSVGAHSHLDGTSIVDVSERNIVIRLVNAPWSGHCVQSGE